MGGLTRVLGAADDEAIAETGRVVAAYLPDGVEDLEELIGLGRLLIDLGRLEYGAMPPS